MRFPADFPPALVQALGRAQGMLRRSRVVLSGMAGRIHSDGSSPDAQRELEAQHRLRRDMSIQLSDSLRIRRFIEVEGLFLEIQCVIAEEDELFALMKTCYEIGLQKGLDLRPIDPITSESWNNACAGLGTKA